ncbi:MAG: hypothetical protein NVS3B24_19070 [Candidatus Dormibacteria bacterium]
MRTRIATTSLVIPLLVACGGSSGHSDKTVKKQTGSATTSPSASESASAPGGSDVATVDRSFWYDGYKVTLVDAAITRPTKPSPGYSVAKTKLLINATFENLGPDTATPYNLELVLESGTNSYVDHDSEDEKIPAVPGLQKTKGVIAFFIDDKFSLDNAVLLAGSARNNQAQVALGKSGKSDVLEPQKVAISGTINQAGAFTMTVSGGQLSYDDPKDHKEMKAKEVLLSVTFAVTGLRDQSCCLGTDNLILKLPDGTAVAATRNSTVTIPGKGLTTADETAEWVFKAADGAYDLIVKGKYGADRAEQQADLPFTITLGKSASSSSTPAVGGAYPSPSDSGAPQPTPSGH